MADVCAQKANFTMEKPASLAVKGVAVVTLLGMINARAVPLLLPLIHQMNLFVNILPL